MDMSSDGRPSSSEVAAEPAVTTASLVMALDGSLVRQVDHRVAVEAPVQVAFAGVPFAVMMLTPSELVDFAYGFSLTEGMIAAAADVRDVVVGEAKGGLMLDIALVGNRLGQHLSRQRAMTGRTGCGVCGIDDIKALRRAEAKPHESKPIAVASIARALRALDAAQVLNTETRAVHGAAFANSSGAILAVREDVGRHNALDKLIGATLRAGIDPAEGFFLITSRCSFEMVEKAAIAGTRTLVAISAPTSLAISRARALDLTLIAIARRDTLAVFNGAENVEILQT